jgi:hypothetical protein
MFREDIRERVWKVARRFQERPRAGEVFKSRSGDLSAGYHSLQTLYRTPAGLEKKMWVDDNEYGNWQQVTAMKLTIRTARKATTRRLKQLP